MVLLLSEPAELQKCVLSDSLTTVSQGGQDLGNFSMTVDFGRKGQQSCIVLHALSQGAIDGSPCGTSVTGELRAKLVHVPLYQCPHPLGTVHVATDLEVLEENYHEYIKVSKIPTLSPLLFHLHDFLFYLHNHLFITLLLFYSWREEVWTSNVTWFNVMGRW